MRGRRTAATLLYLVAANALAAGYGFVAQPDGSALGIPVDWLEDSPFDDYRIPGLLLAALGLLAAVAATLQVRRHRLAWAWTGTSGAGFVVWIVVQAAMMGSFRHPMQTILQAAILTLGLVVGGIALMQWRDAARDPAPRRLGARR